MNTLTRRIATLVAAHALTAARQGFEPWAPFGATVFDTARFGRSRTLPTPRQ